MIAFQWLALALPEHCEYSEDLMLHSGKQQS